MKLKPYETDNLVFFDTEFSDLDPYKGELLSVALIKKSGEELYLEIDYQGSCSAWVKKNILPMLKGPKVSKKQAIARICEFLGDSMPYAIAFVDNYDVIYMTKLFGANNLPFRWMSVDFSTILFAMGINPVKYLADERSATSFYKKLGIDVKKYNAHHALDDARLLRDVWLKLV